MRMSYAVPHANGRFYLPSRVREWIQLPRNCRLHGRLIEDAPEPSIIFSPIPVDDWPNCFRIIINTSDKLGSLHTALDALHKADLNILHMVAAATSGAGALSVTSIVAHMGASHLHNIKSARKNQRNNKEHLAVMSKSIESTIKKNMGQALSNSPLYSKNNQFDLREIRATPLKVLRALGLIQHNPNSTLGQRLNTHYKSHFSLNVLNGIIDLQSVPLAVTRPNLASSESVYEVMQHDNTDKSISLVITADPDEYHFRVGLLPPKRFTHIDIRLRSSSARESSLMGLTRDIVGTFKTLPCPVNIYYASSVTVDSTTTTNQRNNKEEYKERFRVKLAGDISNIVGHKPGNRAHDKITRELKKRVRELAASDKDRQIEFDDQDDNSHEIAVRPLMAPLVFTATNVKETMKSEHIQMALDLFALLKNMNMRPIFVPTLLGDATAREQMSVLLDVCPMLISLYLPEKATMLATADRHYPWRYSPSTWTTFEEAYMTSLPNRHVFRLLHDKVFPPPFIERTSILGFSNLTQFEIELDRLQSRIIASQDTGAWRRALVACGDRLAEQGLDLERIGGCDPEVWLLERLKQAGRWRNNRLYPPPQGTNPRQGRRRKSRPTETASSRPAPKSTHETISSRT